MGTGIAQVAAMARNEVVLYDNNEIVLNNSAKSLVNTFNKLVEKGKIDKDKSSEILKRISFVHELKKFNNCDLIIEAILENLNVKQNLFKELEQIVPANCVLATNTSSLSVTSIASVCTKPDRCLGIHFFNPAPLMPLVEIVPGMSTDNEITVQVRNLINKWGKTTVLAKDTPGFIVNRVARPFYGEAIRIYEEGIADFATIDWAMKEFGGFKMGPFELMDLIGNDVNYKVTETVWEQFFYDPRYKPSFTQKRMVEANRLGRKNGIGYYNYANGTENPHPVKDEKKGKDIFLRILAMLINEAIEALHFNIANKEDIDLAMTKGVNYPKGLLKWADDIGHEKILSVIMNLQDEYGEDRYRPSILLKKIVRENKKNYQ